MSYQGIVFIRIPLVERAWCVVLTNVSLVAGVVIGRVDDDLMVIVPGDSDVVSLSGRPAQVLADVEAGRKVDSTDSALRDLVDLGIVSAPGLSRRGLFVGAIGAGAGIAVLALPSPAMAASASVQEIRIDNLFAGITTVTNVISIQILSPEFPDGLSAGVAGVYTTLQGRDFAMAHNGINSFMVTGTPTTDDDHDELSDLVGGTLRFEFGGVSYIGTHVVP